MPKTAAILQIEGHPRHAEGERLATALTKLNAYLTAATARFLALVREFDEGRYWETDGICSCAHWLNWQCGIGMNAAREKVRVARALGSLPKIEKAFARGEVSYSKVRAMTRVANPESQDYLLGIAEYGTAYHTERLIAHYRRTCRLQEAQEHKDQRRHRFLSTRWGTDGSLVLNGRIPGEQGALILKALELVQERQLAERQQAANDPAAEGSINHLARPMRRADALAEIAENYLATEAPAGSGGDRYQVVVHVSAETLPAEKPQVSGIENGPRVSAETSRRLSCDCGVVRLLKDRNDEPLSVGRKTRSIPPAIRRALQVRDGGCRFPGCTHTRFVDGHHVEHWADGGETSLDNLVLLCRRHHRLVHEGGFGCERSVTGNFLFKSPSGNIIPAGPTGKPTADNDPTAWIRENMPCEHIDATTGVTRWQGECIDWNLAVGHLFSYRRD